MSRPLSHAREQRHARNGREPRVPWVRPGLFAAHDAATGKVLWQTQLDQGIATPVSYELEGRQYIAVVDSDLGRRNAPD